MPSTTRRSRPLLLASLLVAGGCGQPPVPVSENAPPPTPPFETVTGPDASELSPGQPPMDVTGDVTADAIPPPPEWPERSPEDVVAHVGDETITEGELMAWLRNYATDERTGQPVPEEMLRAQREQSGPEILEAMINERLVVEAIEDASFELTDDDYRAEMQREVDTMLLSNGVSSEEFAQQVQAAEGVTLEEFVEQRATSEGYRQNVQLVRLIEAAFPERTAVTDADVEEVYAAEREFVWTREPEVKARHILFEVGEDPEAARALAADVLAQARDGADFAELARLHSTGPSGPMGGDLGWFGREGDMVEPFAAAAFELASGAISDPVETQFGLHLIQVTDRREGGEVPLDVAAPAIRRRLEGERVGGVLDEYIASLRDGLEIEIVGETASDDTEPAPASPDQ